MGEQCSHAISPEYPDFREYAHSGDDGDDRSRWLLGEGVPGVEDGTWSCPHDVVAGFDKCPFHVPVSERPPDLDVTSEFLRRIEKSRELDTRDARRREVQFIDATFESFDIAGEILETGTNYGIDLSHATLSGVDMTDARVEQQIRFSHATFEGPSYFRNAQFDGFVGMRGAEFRGPARFRGATFDRPFNVRTGRSATTCTSGTPSSDGTPSSAMSTFIDTRTFEASTSTTTSGSRRRVFTKRRCLT